MKNLLQVGMIVFAIALCDTASASVINLSNVPDLSQHSGAGWANYCAPTSGANVAYYHGQTYGSLVPGDAFPFSSTSAANNIIAGPASPPPLGGSMAFHMNTLTSVGTTGNDLRDGLDLYMENNWDATVGGTDWTTTYHSAAAMGGAAFWNLLVSEITNGNPAILLIDWAAGAPGGYDLPDEGTGNTAGSAISHAVTMTGFNNNVPSVPIMNINDPANNGGGAHAFGGEGAAYVVTVNAGNITFSIGGSTARVYGAVTTNIPAPGAAALLLLSGLVGGTRRRRR